MTTDAAQQPKQQVPPKPAGRPEKPGGAYKDTLNLPQTDFPMEAKLVQNEPARLRRWQETAAQERAVEAREVVLVVPRAEDEILVERRGPVVPDRELSSDRGPGGITLRHAEH